MSKAIFMSTILFIAFCTIIGIEALKQITELEEDVRDYETRIK
jgi:hypothetical protein